MLLMRADFFCRNTGIRKKKTPPLTSSAVLLFFLDAVFDAVVLLVYVLVASDLTEHAAGLLGQPTLN